MFSLAAPARADEKLRIGGAEVVVTASNGFQRLRFKGQSIAEGEEIRLAERLADQGAEAVVFEVKPGGSACKPGILVLTAKAGDEPRFDRRLIDECGGFEIARSERAILLVSPPHPAVQGALWRVAAESGLTLEATLAFTPQPGTGFSDLKVGATAPALLRNQAVWMAFAALTGSETKRYATLFTMPGPAIEARPPLVAAIGCSGDCRQADALMVADPIKRSLYLATRIKGQPPQALPELNRWPVEAKAVFENWARR